MDDIVVPVPVPDCPQARRAARRSLRACRPQPAALAAVAALLAAILLAQPALAVSLATGVDHNLMLRDDGTVWAWGKNDFGQLGDGTATNRSSPTLVLTGARAIAAGSSHSVAVRTDGTLWAWGSGLLGDGSTAARHVPVLIMGGVQAVAAYTHTLALKTDGTLWAWGANDSGQLGDGTTDYRTTPFQIMSGVRTMAAGGGYSMAVRTDGTLWAWGTNSLGQLGDGGTAGRSLPVQVLAGVQSVHTGTTHTLAVKGDATLWTWGLGGYGQLGDGPVETRTTPKQVLAGVQAAAAGYQRSLILKADGALWAVGYNRHGELGDGTTVDRENPVPIMTGVRAVVAGDYHNVALKNDGSVLAWGVNGYGRLGEASIVNRAAPAPIVAGVSSIAAGGYHSVALGADGTVRTWGFNFYGALGDGTTVTRTTPVTPLTGVAAVAAGEFHTLAVKADGTLWSWGSNSFGELGDTTPDARPTPLQVMANVRAVAAGNGHTLAIRSDDSLWTWGNNQLGQLGNGGTQFSGAPGQVLTGVAAVAGGGNHSLAVRADGTLWAWGGNFAGQLGDGTTTPRATPVQVLSGVQAVAAGADHSLALKADGTLWAWGYNFDGQLGAGDLGRYRSPVQVLSGVRRVAAGGGSTVAVKTDGTVWVWGVGRDGLLGPGIGGAHAATPVENPFLRSAAALAVGRAHALALTADGRVQAWGDNTRAQLGIAALEQSATPLPVRDPQAAYAGAELVVEYFNPTIRNGAGTPGIGHHFITAAPAEMASIDTGGSGPGWARTGRSFRAWSTAAAAPPGAVPVCRFYARVPNSHFYTAAAAECQSLKDLNPGNDPNLGWSYEGIAFYTVLPAGGQCASGYHPVYRSYNSRFDPDPSRNDGNHRITPSYNDYRRSIRFLGYADEGIAFCSPASAQPGGDLQATYSYPGAAVPAGAPLSAEFLFGNNGAGSGDGGSVYLALPTEVTNWAVTCSPRNGATCPASLDVNRLREGQAVATWPAGGTLAFTATGTAPPVTADGKATLQFAATVARASGSPDSAPANDTPPPAQTVLKAASVCNTVANPAVLQLGPEAQAPHVNLDVGAGCPWSAQGSAPWLTVAPPASGVGDAVLTLALAANTTIAERSGSVVVNGRTILVTQSGIPCTFAATPATLSFTPAGQAGAVALAAPAGCAWSAQSHAAWLAVSPASGAGPAGLTVTVQGNAAAAAREGNFTLGTLSFPVTQAGVSVAAPPPSPPADPCATLRLQREGDQVAHGGLTGALAFDVLADTRCAWSVVSNASWITLAAGSGGIGSGTVSYLVEPNGDLQSRTGTLAVGAKSFTVNQLGYVDPGTGGDGSGGGGDSGGDGGGGSSGGGAG